MAGVHHDPDPEGLLAEGAAAVQRLEEDEVAEQAEREEQDEHGERPARERAAPPDAAQEDPEDDPGDQREAGHRDGGVEQPRGRARAHTRQLEMYGHVLGGLDPELLPQGRRRSARSSTAP